MNFSLRSEWWKNPQKTRHFCFSFFKFKRFSVRANARLDYLAFVYTIKRWSKSSSVLGLFVCTRRERGTTIKSNMNENDSSQAHTPLLTTFRRKKEKNRQNKIEMLFSTRVLPYARQTNEANEGKRNAIVEWKCVPNLFLFACLRQCNCSNLKKRAEKEESRRRKADKRNGQHQSIREFLISFPYFLYRLALAITALALTATATMKTTFRPNRNTFLSS